MFFLSQPINAAKRSEHVNAYLMFCLPYKTKTYPINNDSLVMTNE